MNQKLTQLQEQTAKDSMWPKISIVTPSYNQGKFLEATIQSILFQNYPNLEYIIIDGGSTDNSIDIIRKYETKLAYWVSEPDRGHYHAINKGFEYATGEIMTWLNSDDLYFPWTLRTVATIYMSLPEIEWTTALMQGICDWHGFYLDVHKLPGFSRDAFLDGCYLPPLHSYSYGWIQQESTFWRRSLWEKVGGLNEDLRLAGDYDLWARFYLLSDLFGVDSLLAGFRTQHEQRSRHLSEYAQEACTALEEMRREISWKPNRARNMMRRRYLWRLQRMIKNKNLYAYQGKKVMRRDADTEAGYWSIEPYCFY